MIYAIRDRYCECGASPCHRDLTDLLTLAQVLATTGPTFFRTLAASARRRAAVCPELAAEALLVAQDYEERAERLEGSCLS